MKAQSALSVKEANLKAMTAFIYTQGSATKQMFEHELGLSLPTITQNLRAMEADGLIVKGEMQQSTGGRKAQIYEFAAHSSVAIGVRIQTTRITAIAIDLNGKSVATRQRTLPYRNNDAYYQRMNGIINDFAQELAKQGSTVLGVAFCMQGIVSADGQLITFGKIMNNTGLKLNELSHGLNYPSLMIHDSDASAMAELWFDHNLKDAVCIYLERRPRGAVIVDGSLYQGPNQCNGSIEHMTLIPGGNTCYCGQQGCMDTYCSPETLMEDGESLPGFFSVLEQGEQEHRERFSQWLDYVALAVTNIRSVLAGDVIISGEAAQYLDDDDMAGLRERVVEHTPFGTTDFTCAREWRSTIKTLSARLCVLWSRTYANYAICDRFCAHINRISRIDCITKKKRVPNPYIRFSARFFVCFRLFRLLYLFSTII